MTAQPGTSPRSSRSLLVQRLIVQRVIVLIVRPLSGTHLQYGNTRKDREDHRDRKDQEDQWAKQRNRTPLAIFI